jgi:hypothetical protein
MCVLWHEKFRCSRGRNLLLFQYGITSVHDCRGRHKKTYFIVLQNVLKLLLNFWKLEQTLFVTHVPHTGRIAIGNLACPVVREKMTSPPTHTHLGLTLICQVSELLSLCYVELSTVTETHSVLQM